MKEYQDMHSYLDGEMSQSEITAFEESLNQSPALKNQLQSYQQIKSALKNCNEFPETNEVWSRCSERIQELSKTQSTENFFRKYSLAMVSAVAFVLLSAGLLNRMTTANFGEESLARTMSSSSAGVLYYRAEQSGRPEQWMSAQLGTRVRLPNFESKGLYFSSIEEINCPQTKVLRSIYTSSNNIFILLSSTSPDTIGIEGEPSRAVPGATCVQVARLNVISWKSGDVYFTMASKAPLSELEQIIK